MHIMNVLLSVPVGLYFMARRLFSCIGELTDEGLPPLSEIMAKSLAVYRAVRAILRAEHMSHLEGVTTLTWNYMP